MKTGRPPVSAETFTQKTFQGLCINSDGKQLTIRHKEVPLKPSLKDRRTHKRATERRALHDMLRQNMQMIDTAIKNKRVLNFRMSEFLLARRGGAVPIEGGGPFGTLSETKVQLKETDGPTVLVDLEDTIVFWYFPRYIGQGLQAIFLDNLAELVKVCPPMKDPGKGERRSRGSGEKERKTESRGPVTRGRFITWSREKGLQDQEGQRVTQAEAVDDKDGSECSQEELETEGEHPELLEFYTSKEGEVAWASEGDETPLDRDLVEQPPNTEEPEARGVLDSAVLPASRYYFSPAWFQTGMETKRPIATSSQFREALHESSSQQLIALLEGKRLYDAQQEHLVKIIHASLGRSMQRLKASMLKVRGPTKVVLENGWTSPFPCFGFGINRQTLKHRDTSGLSGGMDVIGVLGDFTGGTLSLQDLNAEFEWRPGCLGAFDGYDLTHEVLGWEGGHRITLLSFCRSSTWRGLKLEPELTRPTLDQVVRDLQAAKEERDAEVEACKRKRSDNAKRDSERAAERKRLRVVGLVKDGKAGADATTEPIRLV